MMNLVIDEGNTRAKYAIFQNGEMIMHNTYPAHNEQIIHNIIEQFAPKNCMVCSTKNNKEFFYAISDLFQNFIFLDHTVKLPLNNSYKTPESLGKDRIAAVVGAFTLCEGKDILIVDAGTAITYDFVSAKDGYLGGSISPGLIMRHKALNAFTSKLPLLEPKSTNNPIGTTTVEAIQSGVFNGLKHEIDGICTQFNADFSDGIIFLTGGDALFFDKIVKNTIFVNPNLVLIGLNTILEHNAN